MKTPTKKTTRRLFQAALILALAALALIAVAEFTIRHATKNRTFTDPAATPFRETGLVLGCVKILKNGSPNLFFANRVNAAAELYHAGKISRLIVSGDNHTVGYDEATDMKDALIAKGVPADRIHCDFAGFRTLDSVVRAKKIFGQSEFTVISQAFHNRRAIFLARAHGIDAIGFNAPEVTLHHALRTRLRESLACVKALLDICLRTQPRFLGDPVDISEGRAQPPGAPHKAASEQASRKFHHRVAKDTFLPPQRTGLFSNQVLVEPTVCGAPGGRALPLTGGA